MHKTGPTASIGKGCEEFSSIQIEEIVFQGSAGVSLVDSWLLPHIWSHSKSLQNPLIAAQLASLPAQSVGPSLAVSRKKVPH